MCVFAVVVGSEPRRLVVTTRTRGRECGGGGGAIRAKLLPVVSFVSCCLVFSISATS